MTSTYRCMGSPFLKSVPDPETDVQREMIRSNITSHYLVLGSQPIRIPSPRHTHTYTHPLGLRLKIDPLSSFPRAVLPLWLNSSVSSVSAEVTTAVDSVGS